MVIIPVIITIIYYLNKYVLSTYYVSHSILRIQ
jgi:hypothetical protein